MQNGKQITTAHNGYRSTLVLDETGKIVKREEGGVIPRQTWAYEYDDRGRLTRVTRNGILEETYAYNPSGQRVYQQRSAPLTAPTEGQLAYDPAGRLTSAGQVLFTYDANGALRTMATGNQVRRFAYGGDTLLDKAVLPDGRSLAWVYGDGETAICPIKRIQNNTCITSYFWLDPLRLSAYVDHRSGIEYTIMRDVDGRPDHIRLAFSSEARISETVDKDSSDWLTDMADRKRAERLANMLDGGTRDLLCCCDHNGTVRALTDTHGRLVKEVRYDSFGVLCLDTLPDLDFPIGFAGGLADRDTGLTRFGWRDYLPDVGRFTAPDPVGDTGGDHDLYEYCYDDPVGLNDPSGLFPPALLALLGPAIGLGVPYGIATVMDKIQEKKLGQPYTKGRDAIKKVAKPLLDTVKFTRNMVPGFPQLPGQGHDWNEEDNIINEIKDKLVERISNRSQTKK